MTRYPPHEVIDGFLPADLHHGLLAHALAHEADFVPTEVMQAGADHYEPGVRHSFTCNGGLGTLRDAYRTAVSAQAEALLAALGIPPCSLEPVELQLVAHRQGSFFRPHIDTFTQANRAGQKSDRVLTMVYYLHTQPRRFTGGEIALYPFGPGEPLLIEPCDNRLIAFPSFALHEVKPIATPDGDRFEDARFAVNCWLHRERAGE